MFQHDSRRPYDGIVDTQTSNSRQRNGWSRLWPCRMILEALVTVQNMAT
jgi:hypothetical protein